MCGKLMFYCFCSQPAVTTYEHVFNFMNGHPEEDVFDVSVCFSAGHHYTVFYVEVTSKQFFNSSFDISP